MNIPFALSLLQVFQLLQDRVPFHLDRIRVIGSIGKGTALPNSDFDCVVFINRPIETVFEVLGDFEAVLRPLYPELKRTRWSLQFSADGFDIDILPAVNFIESNSSDDEESLVRAQAEKVYEKILEAEHGKRACTAATYNTSLCESQVRFSRTRTPFTHQLVRITKAWNKSLYIEDYVSGRSTLFELLAVHVASEVEAAAGSAGRSLLIAFQKFLERVIDFENLDIVFPDSCSVPVIEDMIPPKPFLLEPSNPFINMAKGDPRYFTEPIVLKFKEFAAQTLEKLVCENNNGCEIFVGLQPYNEKAILS